MVNFMGYFDKFLMHDDRNKGMNSTSNEKGTDGKKNNTSEYNHQYYMKNKEKWKDNKDTTKEASDLTGMDEESINELRKLANEKGTDSKEYKELLSILAEGDEEQAKKLEAILKKDATSKKEFDIDAAARDVIRGKYGNGGARRKALGADFSAVQRRVNEILEKSNSAKHSDEDQNELYHHGILGQKWGIRRFEKASGGLTAAGRARYQTDANGEYKKIGKIGGGASSIVSTQKNPKVESFVKKNGINGNIEIKNPKGAISLRGKRLNKAAKAAQKDADDLRKHGYNKEADAVQKVADKNREKAKAAEEKTGLTKGQKVAIGVGAGVTAALAAYGGYKLYQLNKKATNGIRDYEKGKADDAFKAAGKMRDVYAINMKVAADHLNNGNKSSSDIMRKSAENFWDRSKEFYQIGSEHTGKAVQKNYSIKDKVDYLKGNYGKVKPGSIEWLQKQGIKTVQPDRIGWEKPSIANSNERLQNTLNQMKRMNTSNKSVSDASNQYVYDLIRKNAQTLSSLGF